MEYETLNPMTWKDVQEIVETADLAIRDEDGLPYRSPEEYYTDVPQILREGCKIPAMIRYNILLRAAESATGWKLTKSRDAHDTLIRTFISYRMHNDGYTYTEIGKQMGRKHSSVMYLYKRMKDILSLPNAYERENRMFEEFETLLLDNPRHDE